jgi:hypothetical protein
MNPNQFQFRVQLIQINKTKHKILYNISQKLINKNRKLLAQSKHPLFFNNKEQLFL